MDTKTASISIMAIIVMLLATGFTVHKYSATDPDANYLCEDLKMLKFCDRVSSTGRTCYPNPDNTKGYKLCDGPWVLLEQYAQENNLVPEPVNTEPAKVFVSPGADGPDKICCPVGGPCYVMVGSRC